MITRKTASYLRNFVFGVEDSLVSTVGVLSGIAAAKTSTPTIILAGVILIFVEAFSMGVGSLLSENVAEEFEEQKEKPLKESLLAGFIMFGSYIIAGFIPLMPYIIFAPQPAFWLSIIFSLASLFILGTAAARLSHTEALKHGIKMCLIGGAAIGLGVAVGLFLNLNLNAV